MRVRGAGEGSERVLAFTGRPSTLFEEKVRARRKEREEEEREAGSPRTAFDVEGSEKQRRATGESTGRHEDSGKRAKSGAT
jgi:hypothetical protein